VLDFALWDPKAFKQLKSRFAKLSKLEQQVIAQVIADGYGSHRAFTAAQRQLAEWHVRALNNGKLISDLASGKVDLKSVRRKYRAVYVDPCEGELRHGGGNDAPHADHHRPKVYGGYNLFSNLLIVSRQQNLRAMSREKNAKITNPNRARSRLSSGLALRDGGRGESSKPRQPPKTHAAKTVERGFRDKPKPLFRHQYEKMFSKENLDAYTDQELGDLVPYAGLALGENEGRKKGKEVVGDSDSDSDSDGEMSLQMEKRKVTPSHAMQSSGSTSTSNPHVRSAIQAPSVSGGEDEAQKKREEAQLPAVLFPDPGEAVGTARVSGRSSEPNVNEDCEAGSDGEAGSDSEADSSELSSDKASSSDDV
jgi:hypothetical protein